VGDRDRILRTRGEWGATALAVASPGWPRVNSQPASSVCGASPQSVYPVVLHLIFR
jgi:hypothetical protein